MGLDRRPDWLQVGVLLDLVGGRELLDERLLRIRRGADAWPAQRELDLASFWAGIEPTGNDAPPLEAFVSPPAEDVLARVCELTGVTRQALGQPVRGRGGNPARRFAIWALTRETTLSHVRIGELFGMSGAHVAQVLSTVRKAEPGPEIEAWKQAWTAEAAIVS